MVFHHGSCAIAIKKTVLSETHVCATNPPELIRNQKLEIRNSFTISLEPRFFHRSRAKETILNTNDTGGLIREGDGMGFVSVHVNVSAFVNGLHPQGCPFVEVAAEA